MWQYDHHMVLLLYLYYNTYSYIILYGSYYNNYWRIKEDHALAITLKENNELFRWILSWENLSYLVDVELWKHGWCGDAYHRACGFQARTKGDLHWLLEGPIKDSPHASWRLSCVSIVMMNVLYTRPLYKVGFQFIQVAFVPTRIP